MLIGKIAVSKTVRREFDSLHSCMKLLAFVPAAVLVLFIFTAYLPLSDSYEALSAKTRLSQKSDADKIDTLEKAKVEQFYRAIYEVCMVIQSDTPKCLSLTKAGVEEYFYNDSAGGWKWPLTDLE